MSGMNTMNEKLRRKGRKLSWLLRHGAHETRLDMDPAGWAPVDQVLRVLNLQREQLELLVADNTEPLRAPTTAEAAASDFVLPGTISEAASALSWPAPWHMIRCAWTGDPWSNGGHWMVRR